MAVEHAFRPPGGARGVAERARRVFVELRPRIILVRLGQQRLIAIEAHARSERDILHAGLVGQQHDGADAGAHRGRNFGDKRGEGRIGEQNAVFSVGHDEGDVLRREAWIDRVADRAHAGDAIVEFEVTEIVPCERRHAIAEADAEFAQRARQPPAAPLDLGVGGSMERRAAEVRDHFRSAAMTRGVGDERGNQQRIALHQSEHESPPCGARELRRPGSPRLHTAPFLCVEQRARRQSSAPQHGAGAADGLDPRTKPPRFTAGLGGQADAVERSPATAAQDGAEHKGIHVTNHACVVMPGAGEGAQRRAFRETGGDLHAPGREPARNHGGRRRGRAQARDQAEARRARGGRSHGWCRSGRRAGGRSGGGWRRGRRGRGA